MGFSFSTDNKRSEFYYFWLGDFTCIRWVLFFLRSNRKFYLKKITHKSNFFSPLSRCDLWDHLLYMESRGKRIVGKLWEKIPFSNLWYLFPILKAQLPNICEYSAGFALLILSLVMFAFLSVVCIFQPLGTDITCPVT